MNKSKFEELVNLYFDREISVAELECLKNELASKAERRREFQAQYRLHQATCSVLFSETAIPFNQVHATQVSNTKKYTPSLLSGLGVAACFLVVFATSTLFMRDSIDTLDTSTAKTGYLPHEVQYPESNESKQPLSGSLSSKLRLAGLTPDIVPSDHQLSTVDAEALRQREAHLKDVIEQVNYYRAYSAIPEQRLIESSERSYRASPSNDWSAGFKSSLAGFTFK